MILLNLEKWEKELLALSLFETYMTGEEATKRMTAEIVDLAFKLGIAEEFNLFAKGYIEFVNKQDKQTP